MTNTNTATEKRRYDTKEAAQYLDCSASWLEKARCEGKGPAYLKRGGRVLYRREDLDAFDAASTIQTVDSRRLAAQAAG